MQVIYERALTAKWIKTAPALAIATFLLGATVAHARLEIDKSSIGLGPGTAEQLHLKKIDSEGVRWSSSNPKVAAVYQNGFVVALGAGSATVMASASGESPAQCEVTVAESARPLIDPATLRQYDDNRIFTIDGRRCAGSELNGQRAVGRDERRVTRSNRVLNPDPPTPDEPREWPVEDGAEIYDGAGILMGTVAPSRNVGGKRFPVSMFNFGMSKVIDGKLCLYAFSVPIKPSPAIAKLIDPAEMQGGTVDTSAWLPLDRVVQKESLLERVGVGKVKLPRLPLEEKSYRITGGDAKMYASGFGEMSIIKDIHAGPVPSHYLRRPSGTVNIIYSVPGFGFGGQGLDSFLVSENAIFRPAKGAKVFVQPTYFPVKHPRAGDVSPMTMTFLYGAVELKGSEPVYGWVAKEALQAINPDRR